MTQRDSLGPENHIPEDHGPENHEEEIKHSPRKPWKHRLRRFFLRHVPLTIAGAAVLLTVSAICLFLYASSASFENTMRKQLAASLQSLTGGRVEIAAFHWNLLNLDADADGLVIHGLESAGEAPYLRVAHLHVRFALLGVLTPRFISRNIVLRALEIQQPELHLIVYRNGTTNQPHPARPRKPGEPALDRLFDLKAGRISVEQGIVHYENRAAVFDFQNRYIPLDFVASDASLHTSYAPAAAGEPESYRIETSAADLMIARGGTRLVSPPVHGRMQATLDLTRNAVLLRSLSLTAQAAGTAPRIVTITGTLQDFTHPHWQALTRGELDMRLLDSLTGYPDAPTGIAHLDLAAAGDAGEFRIDGAVHVDDGAYVGTGVVARNVTLDAHVHADPQQLLITKIVARFRQGGQMQGTVDLAHWLETVAGAAAFEPAPPRSSRATSRRAAPAVRPVLPPRPADTTIPIDGKVTAQLDNVSLDTILDIASQQPFMRLGLDARLNGPANATWTKGDYNTVAVSAMLNMSPSAETVPNEAPASGVIDAIYTQRDGSVNLHRLDLHLPGSQLQASGRFGAYPMSSPTSLAVDFQSRNLAEFDTILRSLGLKLNGKTGAAALPVTLAGQANFHGVWTGSLIRPRIAGNLKATQLAIEIPPPANDLSTRPQAISLDSAEATGSYSLSRIAIDHGVMTHGAASVSVSGTLDATPAPTLSGYAGAVPTYYRDSVVHARVQAAEVGVDQLQPFFINKLPVTGTLATQFQADGPLRAPNGSGWMELEDGSIYGEPVPRARAQGTLANQVLTLASFNGIAEGGTMSGAGSYDFKAHRFQANAKGAGLGISRFGWLQRHRTPVTGTLGFTVSGSGALDDPQIEAHADLTSLVLAGQHLGSLEAVAHTTGHAVVYDLTTHLEGAQLALHGQTQLSDGYSTDNHLAFSNFDIGALLRLVHFDAVSGESALAGTVTLAGPLAHTDQLHGEANLKEIALVVAGVHLQSIGGAHATLTGDRIRLDSLHITGENTDLGIEATLAFNNDNRLDLATKGSINLKLAESLDPDLTASGVTTFQVEAHGPLQNPGLTGRIQIANGSLSLEDLPNGLSQVQGTLEFNQNRLEVRSLTAMTGGGQLTVGGSLSYQHGVFADLSVSGQQVRIRYPEGITSLANATLHLQGTETNLLLSGDVLITRFNASPDLDLAAIASQAAAAAQAIPPPDAPSNHVRLDVHLVSSPQLNFQNAYAKLAGDVDLRVRGTLASPSLLGRVSITDGSAMIAGTRYDLQRADISFTNPVRIEPSIDLTATAHVEDYDITLGLHGTPEKLVVTYRSDPPLPEADVVALLALGHTADQQRLYTQQQEQQLTNPTTDVLLGGALNATVSSRVQKLFGAGSVKVDPNYLGAFGNSTSRITVEEQLGRNLTLTYATDVNTTGQQLLQAEVAINTHLSLVVARDESGVFSMVIKNTRRFR